MDEFRAGVRSSRHGWRGGSRPGVEHSGEDRDAAQADRERLAGQMRVLEMVATGKPVAETLVELIRFVEAEEPGIRCGILIVANDGTHFQRAIGPQLPEAYHTALAGAAIDPPYRAPCAEAADQGVPVVAPDIAGDERWPQEWRALALSAGLAACRSTPVFGPDGEMLASFDMYYGELRALHPDNPELIEISTHLAGIALAGNRSQATMRAREEQLEQDLAATQHLQEISTLLFQEQEGGNFYSRLLEAAAGVMRSDMASIQMFDERRLELSLLAHKDFHASSAAFWEWVRADSGSTCGGALDSRQRIVVSDVETCDFMRGTADLEAYRRSGIRAVQSTPLISRSGGVLGMISTHWRHVHQPSEQDWRLFDILARQAADLIDRTQAVRALRERTEQLEAVLETAPAGVWFTHDREVTHATGNRQAEAMFRTGERANLSLGAPKEERPAVKICRNGSVLAKEELPLQRAARGEQVAEEELEFRYADGGSVTVLLRASTLRDSAGEPAGAVAAAIDISARKHAEDALRESESRFREMADNAPMMVWVTDTNDQCTFMSRSWRDFTGQPVEEALGRGWLDCIHPDDKERVDKASSEAAPRPVEFREEYRLRHRGGGWRWAIDAAAPRFDSSGSFLGHIGSVVDITDRIEIERTLEEVSERARALATERAAVLGQLAEGVIVTDTMGRITFVNAAAERIHGVARLDVPPEEYAEAFHLFTEDGHPYPSEQLPLTRAVLRGETVTDARWRIRQPDGTEVLAIGNASPVRGEDGSVIGNVLTLRDDTAREAGERELREADLRKNIALSAGEMGVWDWDIPQDRLVWDAAEFAIYGADPERLDPTYQGFESFIHPEDRADFSVAAEEALKQRAPLDTEFRILRPDGQERWISERAVIITDQKGEPVRMVGVSFDITDRKKADERRNLLINELNHRVKNTLATVQSIASQTLKNSAVGPEVREAFESRLISLSKTHDVLTRQNWEGARLGEIADQSLRPFEAAGETRIAVSGPDIRLSPKAALAISMALHELATNAVKYGALSGERGTVRLEWKIADGLLTIYWQESGGPAVEPPRHKGFGSRLIERSLAGELGGKVQMEYLRRGVVCRIEAPLANVG